jgi:hypothetical protein
MVPPAALYQSPRTNQNEPMPAMIRFKPLLPKALRNALHGALVVTLLSLLALRPLWAQIDFPEPNWSAPAARAAALQADANAVLGPLFDQARLGRDPDLLARLQTLAADERLPVPARERILFDFAQGLGDLPPGAVGPDVLDFLQGYRPRTLVPHPDNDRVGKPLFNIRGATAGSLNAWRRQAGYDAGRTLLAGPTPAAAQDYLAEYNRSSTPGRQGLADALPLASAAQLAAIAGQSLAALPMRPDLSPVAVRAALLLGDPALLRRALAAGDGPHLAGLLTEAAAELDEPGRIDLLFVMLDTASPTNASLAVGTLAPGLLHRPEVADRLFALLGDPAMGSAAALVLAASTRPDLQDRLRELAAGDGLTARRAALALASAGATRPGSGR